MSFLDKSITVAGQKINLFTVLNWIATNPQVIAAGEKAAADIATNAIAAWNRWKNSGASADEATLHAEWEACGVRLQGIRDAWQAQAAVEAAAS